MTDNKFIDEIWKDVLGYEGFYEVSNLGNVRNINGRVLSLHLNHRGYLRVALAYKGVKSFLVHILVAEAFIEPRGDKQVNHKDKNKTNNRPDNLEYVNNRENTSHSLGGLIGNYYRANSPRKKWYSQIEIDGKKKHLGRFDTQIEAHQRYLLALKEYGLTNKYATQIKDGQQMTVNNQISASPAVADKE